MMFRIKILCGRAGSPLVSKNVKEYSFHITSIGYSPERSSIFPSNKLEVLLLWKLPYELTTISFTLDRSDS